MEESKTTHAGVGLAPIADISAVASLLAQAKRVVCLTGAGVSVAAGIPDFRSPGGMYDTLKPELLTASDTDRAIMHEEPTHVVSTDLFEINQLPYLEVRRPFILGLAEQKWKATLSHWFFRVLHDKGKLTRLYTQNIDGLDFQTAIPDDKIVSVHGTLQRIECEFCHADYPQKAFRDALLKNIKDIYKTDVTAPAESSVIPCLKCGKPGVKPATVLYGSSLPKRFSTCRRKDFPGVDVLLVAGTSLTVGPANMLVTEVSADCLRVIINREAVGQALGLKLNAPIEHRGAKGYRDILCAGDCDAVFAELALRLGWVQDLLKYKEHMAPASLSILEKLSSASLSASKSP